jgi:hypothetical protein
LFRLFVAATGLHVGKECTLHAQAVAKTNNYNNSNHTGVIGVEGKVKRDETHAGDLQNAAASSELMMRGASLFEQRLIRSGHCTQRCAQDDGQEAAAHRRKQLCSKMIYCCYQRIKTGRLRGSLRL